ILDFAEDQALTEKEFYTSIPDGSAIIIMNPNHDFKFQVPQTEYNKDYIYGEESFFLGDIDKTKICECIGVEFQRTTSSNRISCQTSTCESTDKFKIPEQTFMKDVFIEVNTDNYDYGELY